MKIDNPCQRYYNFGFFSNFFDVTILGFYLVGKF